MVKKVSEAKKFALEIEILIFRQICILALCSKTSEGPWHPLDITFLEFFCIFITFGSKWLRKTSGWWGFQKSKYFGTPYLSAKDWSSRSEVTWQLFSVKKKREKREQCDHEHAFVNCCENWKPSSHCQLGIIFYEPTILPANSMGWRLTLVWVETLYLRGFHAKTRYERMPSLKLMGPYKPEVFIPANLYASRPFISI